MQPSGAWVGWQRQDSLRTHLNPSSIRPPLPPSREVLFLARSDLACKTKFSLLGQTTLVHFHPSLPCPSPQKGWNCTIFSEARVPKGKGKLPHPPLFLLLSPWDPSHRVTTLRFEFLSTMVFYFFVPSPTPASSGGLPPLSLPSLPTLPTLPTSLTVVHAFPCQVRVITLHSHDFLSSNLFWDSGEWRWERAAIDKIVALISNSLGFSSPS
ncbi:hypothetical protein IE53DRAFT_275244 [Violaceomyces palustris]|uniref:Uncharacterized protein n=1 Tax=Violaceomyces palustris TaxID=1673888 RepID=A0ACD0NMF4_9BASI|nr:hypothetical protein IE53DRAFT_275244 [Violaceomyces palustris]